MLTLMAACSEPAPEADLLVFNGNIYLVDEAFSQAEAFAVNDGRIIAIGTYDQLLDQYRYKRQYDAGGNTIVPGLIDGHAHLYNLGMSMQQVDLVGTTSYQEVLERVAAFQDEKQLPFIEGRGWDQNDWPVKEFPTKEMLDSLFPDIPVALRRIDGHALWVNSKALEMAGITSQTRMEGGEVVLKDGEPSGILVDSPMQLIAAIVPPPSRELQIRALQEAEARCMDLGLTTVNDAGLSRSVIELIDSLQQAGEMKLRVYAMVSNTPENLDHFLDNTGKIKTDRLNVRSVRYTGMEPWAPAAPHCVHPIRIRPVILVP